MGVLSSGGLVSRKYLVPPSGETMRQTPKVLQVQELAQFSQINANKRHD